MLSKTTAEIQDTTANEKAIKTHLLEIITLKKIKKQIAFYLKMCSVVTVHNLSFIKQYDILFTTAKSYTP